MHPRIVFFAALFAVISVVVAPRVATAAPSGLAWDSVTRYAMNADVASLREPGNFDADYATAAAVQPAQAAGGGGFLNKVKQMTAVGKNLKQMMEKGMADKHYIAGSKERVDEVAFQKATITDCGARTITTLDLAKKTYRVDSMDQPSSGGSSSGGGESSGGMGKDDGSKVAIDIKNTALGPKLVAGQSTSGFASDTTFTETQKSGEKQTTTANMIGYYTTYAHPSIRCGVSHNRGMPSAATAAEGITMMSGFMRYIDLMSSTGIANDRLSIKQSGPNVPLDKLSMYDVMAFKGDANHNMAVVTERGNVRSIDANDPAFSIPAGFTKEN